MSVFKALHYKAGLRRHVKSPVIVLIDEVLKIIEVIDVPLEEDVAPVLYERGFLNLVPC